MKIGYNLSLCCPGKGQGSQSSYIVSLLDMENLKQQWQELMAITGVPWIVYGALLIILLIIAIYVVTFFKRLAQGEFSSGSQEDFDVMREIHTRGMIADEEYERAKQLLSEKTDVDDLLNVKQLDQEKE